MVQATLEIKELDKSFIGVHAVDHVSFCCYPGRVHILQGENGAGKSTVLKMLSGMYQPDSGEILIHGKKVDFKSPEDSRRNGIAMVYQEMSILPELTCAENVFLNQEFEILQKRRGFIRQNEIMEAAVRLGEKYRIEIDPYRRAGDLQIGAMQMLEILKALSSDSEILILDEPTSALNKQEVQKLYDIIQNLKREGKTILFISHRMEEVFQFGDDITIMKDGRLVVTKEVKDMTSNDIITAMVGRELKDIFPPKSQKISDTEILRVEHLSDRGKVRDVSLKIHRGEVLGIAALDGQGQTELLRAIAGVSTRTAGKIFLDNKELNYKNPRQALKAGIGYVPEDRKTQGLCLKLSVNDNVAMASLGRRQSASFIHRKAEKELVQKMIESMNIKTPSPDQQVVNLSGGNQQKVSIGKSLANGPRVLLLNEPTRGIDVEAKQEIYRLIRRLADSGVGILFYTSDMMESIGLSDRIITVFEGKITGEINVDCMHEETIMKAVMNIR